MSSRNAAPCLIVVFDITAALERLELLPALAELFAKKKLHDETQILGLSEKQPPELFELRTDVRQKLTRADVSAEGIAPLLERLHLEPIYGHDATGYEILMHSLKGFERAYGLPGDRLLDLLCVSSRASSVLELALCAGFSRSRGRLGAIIDDSQAAPSPLGPRSFFQRPRLIPVNRDCDRGSLWKSLSESISDFVVSRRG